MARVPQWLQSLADYIDRGLTTVMQYWIGTDFGLMSLLNRGYGMDPDALKNELSKHVKSISMVPRLTKILTAIQNKIEAVQDRMNDYGYSASELVSTAIRKAREADKHEIESLRNTQKEVNALSDDVAEINRQETNMRNELTNADESDLRKYNSGFGAETSGFKRLVASEPDQEKIANTETKLSEIEKKIGG